MGNFQPTPMQAPGQFQQPQQGQGGQGQKPQAITVTDWSQVPDGAASRLDPTDDPWAFSAPPPMGKYRLKLFMPKDGILYKQDKDGQPMFYTNMECRIQSPENPSINNFPVFDWANTSMGRGKQLSTMAGLMRNGGINIPAEATPKQVAMGFQQWLKSEPVLWAFCDWDGQIQDGEDRRGNTNYVTKFSSMVDFPPKKDGGYEHLVKVTTKNGGWTECRAQLKVKVWGTLQDVAVPHQPVAMQPGAFAAPPQFAAAPAPMAAPSPFGQAPPNNPAAPGVGLQPVPAQPAPAPNPFGQPAAPAPAPQMNAGATGAPAQDLNSILRG